MARDSARGLVTLEETHSTPARNTGGASKPLAAAQDQGRATDSPPEGQPVYAGDMPCFYGGTMLAVPSGKVPVEKLKAGDLVLTIDGRALPVCWAGRSHVLSRSADPLRCLPVRIKAGALADGMPARDLLISPDHALFINDVLVQAGGLVNGTSIIRETALPEEFFYYHIGLASHELLLAEDTPAESFLDNSGRMQGAGQAHHEAPKVFILEMEYPRARSARQVPRAVRRQIESRSGQFAAAKKV